MVVEGGLNSCNSTEPHQYVFCEEGIVVGPTMGSEKSGTAKSGKDGCETAVAAIV